jgi:hypothetical protein
MRYAETRARLRSRIRSLVSSPLDSGAPLPLDLDRLAAIARDHRDAYAAAEPFPHAVIDGLFDDAVLERVRREFSTELPGSRTCPVTWRSNARCATTRRRPASRPTCASSSRT